MATETADDATAELLTALDELYPLPDDAKRVERAGRTAYVLTRWMSRVMTEFEASIPALIDKLRQQADGD